MKAGIFSLLASGAILVAGCSQSEPSKSEQATPPVGAPRGLYAGNQPPAAATNEEASPVATPTVAPVGASSHAVASSVGEVSPADRGVTEADRGIVQIIRKSLLTDPPIASAATNIAIACSNGVVTLTGSVPSDNVKMGIRDKAEAAAGVTKVDNQLEVK